MTTPLEQQLAEAHKTLTEASGLGICIGYSVDSRKGFPSTSFHAYSIDHAEMASAYGTTLEEVIPKFIASSNEHKEKRRAEAIANFRKQFPNVTLPPELSPKT